jgi:hypothetical protein
MTAQQEVQAAVAQTIRQGVERIYFVGEWFSDSTMQAVDDAITDLWKAFGFRMVVCGGCQMQVPEVLTTEQQGRSYCPECSSKQTVYSTTGNWRRRSTIRYRRPR